MVVSNLESFYLLEDELEKITHVINALIEPIKLKLESTTQRIVEVVPTGSVFERYGKPLRAPAYETNLKTDYDVRFSFDKKDLPIRTEMKDCEFLYIFSLSDCNFLNKIRQSSKDKNNLGFTESDSDSPMEVMTREEVKLSASKAREFMMEIVEKTPLQDDTSFIKRNLRNLLALLFNIPRIGRSNSKLLCI